MIDLFIHLMKLLVLADYFFFQFLTNNRNGKPGMKFARAFTFLFCQEIWLNIF